MAQETIRSETEDRIYRQYFEKLGEGCRNIIRLSLTIGSLKQVAERLKISYGYARKKKSECVGRLVKMIQASPEFLMMRF